MKPSIVCEACQTPFIPDCRHLLRQRFCHRLSCQQARRREGQRLRRARLRDSLNLEIGFIPLFRGWLNDEAALVKPHQNALKRFHPVIIGLISQLIDSPHPEDILAFIRRCIQRGQDIMSPPRVTARTRTLKTNGNVNHPTTDSGEAA